jgi:hypothetical protein
MNDKQVVELYYKLKTIESVNFKSPPPIEDETDSFNYSLNNGKLTIKFKQPCSSVEEAKNLIDDFLRSWEIDDALRNGGRRFKFELYDAKIIDPNNPNATIIYTQGINFTLGGSGELNFIYPCYPNPPNLFKISPDVITLWQRYEEYLNNHEPLQSMANACRTFIISLTGNKKAAENKFSIDIGVLRKLGELTAESRGNKKNVRKFKSGVSPRPLSPIEIEWIKAALMAIIRRVGEIDAAASLRIITMNDLPKLT